MGLLWSLETKDPAAPFFQLPDDSVRIDLTVAQEGRVVARRRLTRQVAAPGSRVVEIWPRETGIRARLHLPRDPVEGPPLMLLGGSDGGLGFNPLAARLAAHGHPTLALAYFGEPGLPRTLRRIPLEYFGRALRWMRARPEIGGRRIIVLGISRGAEAALLVGGLFPRSVAGVAAYVPSSVVVGAFPESDASAWTFRRRPVPFSREVDMREAGPAGIEVERIRGPLLLVSGGLDSEWASSLATSVIEARLRRTRHRFPVTRLDFPEAGHALGVVVPFVATTGIGGGVPQADADGLRASWPQLLRFLRDPG